MNLCLRKRAGKSYDYRNVIVFQKLCCQIVSRPLQGGGGGGEGPQGPVHTYPDIFESAAFSFRIRLPDGFESALQSGK